MAYRIAGAQNPSFNYTQPIQRLEADAADFSMLINLTVADLAKVTDSDIAACDKTFKDSYNKAKHNLEHELSLLSSQPEYKTLLGIREQWERSMMNWMNALQQLNPKVFQQLNPNPQIHSNPYISHKIALPIINNNTNNINIPQTPSAKTFAESIERLEFMADAFEHQSTTLMDKIVNRDELEGQGREEFFTPTIENLHAKNSNEGSISIMRSYDKAMEEISILEEDLLKRLAPYNNNPDKVFSSTERDTYNNLVENQKEPLTAVKERFETSLRCLNDALLTFYPTAIIDYGNACVGPIIASSIEKDSSSREQQILTSHPYKREVRGDGNCFISSYLTRFLETHLLNDTLGAFISSVVLDFDTWERLGSSERFGKFRARKSLQEKVRNILLELNQIDSTDKNSIMQCVDRLVQDNKRLIPLIRYFRLLAADRMFQERNRFEAFFSLDLKTEHNINAADADEKPYEELVATYVLHMGAFFSDAAITALCEQVKFSPIIIDLRIGNISGRNHHDKFSPSCTLCRNDCHYFVLYTAKESKEMQPSSITTSTTTATTTNTTTPISRGHLQFDVPSAEANFLTSELLRNIIKGNGTNNTTTSPVSTTYLETTRTTTTTTTSPISAPKDNSLLSPINRPTGFLPTPVTNAPIGTRSNNNNTINIPTPKPVVSIPETKLSINSTNNTTTSPISSKLTSNGPLNSVPTIPTPKPPISNVSTNTTALSTPISVETVSSHDTFGAVSEESHLYFQDYIRTGTVSSNPTNDTTTSPISTKPVSNGPLPMPVTNTSSSTTAAITTKTINNTPSTTTPKPASATINNITPKPVASAPEIKNGPATKKITFHIDGLVRGDKVSALGEGGPLHNWDTAIELIPEDGNGNYIFEFPANSPPSAFLLKLNNTKWENFKGYRKPNRNKNNEVKF